jgi:hypothetical protein
MADIGLVLGVNDMMFGSDVNDFLAFFGGFFAFFFCTSIVVGQLLSGCGWQASKSTYMIHSSTVAMCHGGFAVYFSYKLLMKHEYQLDAPNEQDQLRIMAFSTAYFFNDCIFLLRHMPDEFAFIVHHVITVAYLFSCAYHGFGSFSIMPLMFAGEISNPPHNMNLIIEEILKQEKPPRWASAAAPCVRTLFHIVFAFCRYFESCTNNHHLAHAK